MIKRIIAEILRITKYLFEDNFIEIFRLGKFAKRNLMPRGLDMDSPPNYIPDRFLSHRGLDFNEEKQVSLLEKWGRDYKHFYEEIRLDSDINTQFLGKEYLHNSFYPTPDAEIYMSIILDIKPKKIIEVGSGFSTLIAQKSIRLGNLTTQLHVIDPEPRADITTVADIIQNQYVESLPIESFPSGDKTILFIDSSHISRPLGDLPFIYCQLIPSLSKGTIVHIHDVFLPYDYPLEFQRRMYTETYLLHTMLSNTNRYEIVFSTHYMSRKYPSIMQASISPIVANHNRFNGASFWVKVI